MSQYIPFTETQKEQAATVNLEEFLRDRGEKLLASGREKRLARDHSITIRGNEWYDHAAEKGGNAISFVKNFYGMNYPEAMTLLLGEGDGAVYPSAKERVEEPHKPFALPPINSDMRRVYAYLVKHRKIDRAVISEFARCKLIYEDGEYHNAVFVGLDENSIPRHAHKRSTNSYGKTFRINVEGSDPKHCFHWLGGDKTLYVFEAPIDLLSYISLNPESWQNHNYVACCGISAIPVQEMVRQLPQVERVYLGLDNDQAGHAACVRIANLLTEQHLLVERLVPQNKDWNDDLTLRDENTQGFTMCEMR